MGPLQSGEGGGPILIPSVNNGVFHVQHKQGTVNNNMFHGEHPQGRQYMYTSDKGTVTLCDTAKTNMLSAPQDDT